MRSARSSRYALRSTPTTRAAPRTRATAIAAQPIGPQPNTTTVRPSRSPYEQACTALPNGSMAAATSAATASPTGHTFADGHGEMGRERTVDVDAEDARVLADVEVAATAFVAVTADDVRLDGHAGPERRTCDAVTPGDDLAADLVADHARRMHARRRPGIPVVEVHVGAAHRCRGDAEEHLAGRGRRASGRRRSRTRAQASV